jgi:hypothetical protein
MKTRLALFTIGLALALFGSHEAGAGGASAELADGAISYVQSMRCERSRGDASLPNVEWTGLTYAAGRPPAWGKRPVGPCRGLDTWVLGEAVAAGAFWATNDHPTIEAAPMKTMWDPKMTHAAFKKLLGWDLPERGDDVPPPYVFLKYDAKKVAALFEQVYVKPEEKIAMMTGQQVYDFFFKDFVTRFAREVALVKTSVPKPQLAKLLKAYQAAAKAKGAQFNGPAYLKETATAALAKAPAEAPRAGRTLGVILRRTGDGTWPTIDKLLQRVVRDYDPALFKEIGASL